MLNEKNGKKYKLKNWSWWHRKSENHKLFKSYFFHTFFLILYSILQCFILWKLNLGRKWFILLERVTFQFFSFNEILNYVQRDNLFFRKQFLSFFLFVFYSISLYWWHKKSINILHLQKKSFALFFEWYSVKKIFNLFSMKNWFYFIFKGFFCQFLISIKTVDAYLR